MLGKLIKNEIKATARLFLPLYGLLVVLSFLYKYLLDMRQRFLITQSIVTAVSTFLYIAVITGIVVLSFVMLIQRFYKNLLGDEGYLMHTLPVRASGHIFAKLSVSMLWNLLSTFMVSLSMLYLFTDVKNWGSYWNTFMTGIGEAAQSIGISAPLFLWLGIAATLLATVTKTMSLYAAMGLGQRFAHKNKLGSAVGFAVLFNLLEMIVLRVAFAGVERFNPTLLFPDPHSTVAVASTIYWGLMLYQAAFCVLYAWLANNSLKRHLNLA